jgi:hypothetical protein
MCELIDRVMSMIESLNKEARDKDRFETWAIEYDINVGKCKCSMCNLFDMQIYESYQLLKLYDRIADSDFSSSKIVLFE